MKGFRCMALAAAVAAAGGMSGCVAPGPPVYAEAPACPYGYYDVAPYDCAPYGYYGPEWFAGGVFIGAGPWYHGSANFYGHVNNHFDVHHEYRGPVPRRGERAEAANRVDDASRFQGNEMRDGRGHIGAERR